MLKIEQVQRATSQARHDAIVSGVHVVPDFEDGSHLDDGRPLSSVLSTGRVNVVTVSRAYADEYLNDQRPQSRPHYE